MGEIVKSALWGFYAETDKTGRGVVQLLFTSRSIFYFRMGKNIISKYYLESLGEN